MTCYWPSWPGNEPVNSHWAAIFVFLEPNTNVVVVHNNKLAGKFVYDGKDVRHIWYGTPTFW
ncbi:MAG: hypothetical protein RMJ19_03315 [Gemmatales bacterium]|nr:hypothetical protein [Gemmatales bacterium]MDW8174678.1 hypothetical protein [Gemmatales bacterium]